MNLNKTTEQANSNHNTATLPLVSNLSGLLIEFAQLHGIDHQAPLMKTLQSYGHRQLTMARWIDHLHELAERTGTPEIGLAMGQMVRATHGGVIAYLVLNCRNLAQALSQFERYQRILYGGEGTVTMKGDRVRVSYETPDIEIWRSDELLFSGIIKFVRDVTGRENLYPSEVGFTHRQPSYAEKFEEIFGPNVHFQSPDLYCEFPIEYLTLPIGKGDVALQRILQSQAESLLSVFTIQDEFEQQLQQGIIEILQAGKSGIADLAHALNYSERTLQRRLQERGMNFTDILRKSRKEMASTYLQDQSLSLTEISFLLAYSEQSAFTRAFKKWYGMAPKDYRKII